MNRLVFMVLAIAVFAGQYHVMLNRGEEVSHAPIFGHDEHHDQGSEHDPKHFHEHGVFIIKSTQAPTAPTLLPTGFVKSEAILGVRSVPTRTPTHPGVASNEDLYRRTERYLI
jgi:hypothetical protein